MARKRKRSRKDRLKRGLKFELYGMIILALSVISMASLGAVGRSLTYLFRFFVGTWDFIVPVIGSILALHMMIKREWPRRWTSQYTGIALILIAVLVINHLSMFQAIAVDHPDARETIIRSSWKLVLNETNAELPTDIGGGMIGALIYALLQYLFDDTGTKVVVVVLILAGLLLLTGMSYVHILQKGKQVLERVRAFALERLNAAWDRVQQARHANKRKEEQEPREQKRKEKEAQAQPSDVTPVIHDFSEHAEMTAKTRPPEEPMLADGEDEEPNEPAFTVKLNHDEEINDYQLPSFHLLDKPKKIKQKDEHKGMAANARTLEQTLESFGVRAKVTQIHRGPAVTRYEVQPDIGVKVSRIVNLTDDLALALAAKDIRIEAPIPGKAAIGIEVPNREVAIVTLREVLESPEYHEADSKLTLALGRDISGEAIVGDMTKMPHLLVAGATGSGKSVCINGLITSILYKAKPNEVKFLMIDPKRVELNIYNGIPHLLAPVVTDSRRAALALKKVIAEMEKRYELFAESGARDIARYNQLMAERHPERDYPALPYIVVIIDELADLMMVAPHDVEDAIIRLAQMARAAGIHLIIATQRPSVDVITGVIKANIPSRIAFGVSSQADSRTILDMGGAEKLLGRGDMLYLPVGASKPTRIQGAFLSDQEVESIVAFCKNQQEAQYSEDLMVKSEELHDKSDEVEDELYPQAVQLVTEAKTASVSMLQRRLRVGYTRAARLIDEMEARGIVGPYEGSKPREVLVTPEQARSGEQVPS